MLKVLYNITEKLINHYIINNSKINIKILFYNKVVKGVLMIKKLIIEFDKNNENKKIVKFYIKFGIPILAVSQIFFPTGISISIFIIIIAVLLYFYMYLKTQEKISKKILYVKKNVVEYIKYNANTNRTWVINFLKYNKIYNKESIRFIIDTLKSQKKIKIKRDWISLIISISLAFMTSSIKDGYIDFNNLFRLISQTIPYIITTIVIFITIKSLIWIIKSTIQVEACIEQLEEILTDIYLKLS